MNRQACGCLTVRPRWKTEPRVIYENLFWFLIGSSCHGHIGGNPVRLEAGCLLWISPGQEHAFQLDSSEAPITLFYFRGGIFQRNRPVPVAQPYCVVERAWSLRPIMEQIVDELRAGLYCHEARMQGLMLLMFSEIARLRALKSQDGHQDGRTLGAAQCSRLARFVHQNLSRRPHPAELAAELRLSHDYFSRLFRRTFGTTPRSWVMQERIRHAATLLAESALTAKEAAGVLGYNDVYLFSRQFRQVMGKGPRAWRRERSLQGP